MESRSFSDPKGGVAGKLGALGASEIPDSFVPDTRLLSRLFDELRVAMVLLDNDTTVLYGNRLAHELFAAVGTGLPGSNLLAALSPPDQARLQHGIKDVLAGQAVLLQLDQFKGREFTVTPLYDEGGIAARHFVLCASRDRLCESGTLSGFARQYRLTRSEREILDLVVGGHSAEQIAVHRGVSEATVRTHLKNTLHKTGHRTLRQLQSRLGRLPPV